MIPSRQKGSLDLLKCEIPYTVMRVYKLRQLFILNQHTQGDILLTSLRARRSRRSLHL
jgi:hypothetical protein